MGGESLRRSFSDRLEGPLVSHWLRGFSIRKICILFYTKNLYILEFHRQSSLLYPKAIEVHFAEETRPTENKEM